MNYSPNLNHPKLSIYGIILYGEMVKPVFRLRPIRKVGVQPSDVIYKRIHLVPLKTTNQRPETLLDFADYGKMIFSKTVQKSPYQAQLLYQNMTLTGRVEKTRKDSNVKRCR